MKSETNAIKVLIVDDHAVVRKGLRSFLQAYDDLELVGEASDGDEAVQFCEKLQPDVILMDLMMPRMDGETATAIIRQRFPQVQIIALTSFKGDRLVQKLLNAGAIGYLLKNVSADELAQSIRAARSGQPTLSPEATKALINSATQPRLPDLNLTAREMEVLKLMANGFSNPQIAEKLSISRSTVKFHVSSILAKMNLNTRTEVVSFALHNHLVD
ncbi:LuxR family transcriptional regulator [Ornatilinea apprima]|uniref:LuxR family transcriptional regulator n=1 Tax=Ornatilinea apprima TaxID=1134406 RepID=A0A0P6YAU5_9CHLR|nr:response regulator transcription factor [Ornatilinea apprima]KPL79024.1 LuxR family transcriptional regulator [Ornatilinea apprima]